MISRLLSKIFGTKNTREIRRLQRIVARITSLEAEMETLSDSEIKAKRTEFKSRFESGESLDALLPEAFAVVREAGKRALGMRVFDVQMMGGIALHEGRIAEMRTGEGKTFVATLALYLNAIPATGVHLVTVNDYLAKWGREWMTPLYEALGVTTGVVYAGQMQEEKKAAYQADITYGTNNEFGFDYLRDNMAFSSEERVQRPLNYAIVDEVDSILIDEARTPLIISGGVENSAEIYRTINQLIPRLTRQERTEEDVLEERIPPGDFYVDEKQRDIEITEEGHQKLEKLLQQFGLLAEGDSLYGTANLSLLHNVQSALKASALFQRDVDYIVQNNEIVIVDEHTGRTLPGRRWSGGIHQAIEAKEGVTITNESQTLASTTFQNYFRIYQKLAGMTGTADTEAFEFRQIYGLDVVVIPTNLPMIRRDLNDRVYMTKPEKYEAIVEQILEIKASRAPVLVGTASIESSELLSQLLHKKGIKHHVLNAKFHEQEAEIIAQAGRPESVTIATNMAGRGTDIILGGSWEAEVAELDKASSAQVDAIKEEWKKRHQLVLDAGGLHVIGTERHESRRIDNQLRGRAGRQGDPGFSRFYLSLEDDLMRIFASDRMRAMMQNLGEPGVPIEARMVTSSIERAQRKVEARNFDIRKQLLEYDDVANDQRQMIYRQRDEIMAADEVSETLEVLWQDVIRAAVHQYVPPMSLAEQWDISGLTQSLMADFGLELPIQRWLDEDERLEEHGLIDRILAEAKSAYNAKAHEVGPDIKRFEKRVMLDILDNLWKEHLASMDYLRQGIHLRAYAQKQPKQEYKREAFELFEGLLENVKFEVIRFLSRVQFKTEADVEAMEARRRQEAERTRMQFEKANSPGEPASEESAGSSPFVRQDRKVGRNEPCPCGSGKKYKACHGKLS
ncbi:MAG: preprotein translocase subunit SecA [Pseudomonadales bacterium]